MDLFNKSIVKLMENKVNELNKILDSVEWWYISKLGSNDYIRYRKDYIKEFKEVIEDRNDINNRLSVYKEDIVFIDYLNYYDYLVSIDNMIVKYKELDNSNRYGFKW